LAVAGVPAVQGEGPVHADDVDGPEGGPRLYVLQWRLGEQGPVTLVKPKRPLPGPDDDDKVMRDLGAVVPRGRGTVERPPRKDVEPAVEPVVDGEVVDEQPPIRAWSRRLPAPVQRAASGKTAERAAITAVGMASLAGRAWDGATQGVYRRQIKAAEATGNGEALEKWTVLKEAAAQRRHERLRHLPGMAFGLFAVAVLAVVAAAFVAFVVAVFAPLVAGWSFGGTLAGGLRLVGVLVWAVAGLLLAIMAAAPVVIVAASYREGQRKDRGPSWVTTTTEADTDVEVTELTISRALEALGIPEIRGYLKQGLPLQFIVSARTDGRGTHAVIRLPTGVTAEMVTKRRTRLAGGLYRAAKETWPKTGGEAGILDLWVADKGALEEGAGPYPLLTDGKVDVFKGVPFGRTLRGDDITAPVMERNTIVGGIPGQGKSNAARVIMAGAALDPAAELRIYVPDFNFDFEPFKPRCSRYIMGAEDEHIEAILADLHELYAEVQRRGQILIAQEAQQVTRSLASANVGLHPLFVLLEEAHLLFQHRDHGEELSRLVIDIVKLGRKRAVHIIVSTQAPTRDSIPRDVTRNCSNGIAFYVGDHVPNDALLGQGAYRAGIRATELIPGVDVGTAVCKGFTGGRGEIVQVHRLDVEKTNDQVSPIVRRSLAAIEGAGCTVPQALPAEQRDLLEDLDAVMGDERVKLSDLTGLLRRLAPGWAPYRDLKAKTLKDMLDASSVRVTNTGGILRLDPDDLRLGYPRDDSE
jgi:S-DNA-T family DNA segregation ATPase FtsK/SpoIIIE